MRDEDMRKEIVGLHGEIDSALQAGDRNSINMLISKLHISWEGLFQRDSGLKYTYMFLDIWHREIVREKHTILEDVKSVAEVLVKFRKIRFVLRRLENDFPDEFCLESLQCINDMQLSSTALQYLLPVIVEEEDKVLARISEISNRYMNQ